MRCSGCPQAAAIAGLACAATVLVSGWRSSLQRRQKVDRDWQRPLQCTSGTLFHSACLRQLHPELQVMWELAGCRQPAVSHSLSGLQQASGLTLAEVKEDQLYLPQSGLGRAP